MGSVVVACGLSCPTACGVLEDQGSTPCPLNWKADSLPLDHQGCPAFFFFFFKKYLHLAVWPCQVSAVARGIFGFGAWTLVVAHGLQMRSLTGRSTCAYLFHSRWDLSSPTRDPTHIACFAQWILIYWATREVPAHLTFKRGIIWMYLT